MRICNQGHKEIVHEETDCPLCLVLAQKDDIENDLDNMRDECEVAQERVVELEQLLSGEQEPREINEDDPRKER